MIVKLQAARPNFAEESSLFPKFYQSASSPQPTKNYEPVEIKDKMKTPTVLRNRQAEIKSLLRSPFEKLTFSLRNIWDDFL